MKIIFSILAICFCVPLKAAETDKSQPKDFEALLALAEKGDPNAQYEFGLMLQKFSSKIDDIEIRKKAQKQAVDWFLKAAEQRYSLAQNALFLAYYDGQGVKEDKAMAYVWLKITAESGFYFYDLRGKAKAAFPVLAKQLTPSQVTKSEKEVKEFERRFFEKAKALSAKGNVLAHTNLGDCYSGGFGVAQDKKKAIGWYRKAAVKNEPTAQLTLGIMYGFGSNVEQDVVEGVKWLQKAGENGMTRAFRDLGSLYLSREGIMKDKIRGLAWAKVGEIKGNAWAKATYEGYAKKVTPTQIAEANVLAKELLVIIEGRIKEKQEKK